MVPRSQPRTSPGTAFSYHIKQLPTFDRSILTPLEVQPEGVRGPGALCIRAEDSVDPRVRCMQYAVEADISEDEWI